MPVIRHILPLLLAIGSVLQAADKPNIVFILCDDLGYGDLGSFHQNARAALKDRSVPFFTTPHIDQMAVEGLQLKQHYCAAPVCAPSRASLLTGLTQGHAAVRNNQFDKELPDTHTLGSVLKHAGYATAAIGKWGLQGAPDTPEGRDAPTPPGAAFPGWPSLPIDRGFDDFFGYVRHRDGHYHYPKEDRKQLWENKTEISAGLDLCFSTDLFTAYAKKWITAQQRENPQQPFFVYLAYDTPHAKLQNPPCAYPAGGGLNGGVQWTGNAHAMLNTATGTYDGWIHPDYAGATWDHDSNPATAEQPWPNVQKRYANNVRRIDDSVGDLMQLLADLELDDNTLVVFSSDNGPSEESYIEKHPYTPDFFHGFGPFEGIKRDTLEGGIRVPTIARWPATIKAGSKSGAPNGHWDWLATFAEAAGLPAPAASDGVSLMPTLSGHAEQQAPSTVYIEYAVGGRTPKYQAFDPSHRGKIRGQMQVVISDGYKGLRTGIKSADNDFEIYDLTKDPKELDNLAGTEGFEKIQKKMKALALQRRSANPSAERPYDGALIPALADKPVGMPCAALAYREGKWPWLPNLRREPAFAANPAGFNTPADNFIKAPCAIKLESAILIPADGSYTFTLESDSHSMLFVHDIRLLDELAHASAAPRRASLPLQAGWHPVQLLYRSGEGKPRIALTLSGPDGKEIPLKRDNLQSLNPGW